MAINLCLVLTASLFTGFSAARIVLTLYALELGAPAAVVGTLGALFYLFALLLSWPIGALVDRAGARPLMLFAAACATAAMLLPWLAGTLLAFYAAAALWGLSLAFFHVTLQNTIGLLSRPEERARNFANFSLMGALTNFIGPLFAGACIDHLGYSTACLMTAAPGAISLAMVIAWGRLFPAGNPQATHGIGSLNTLAERNVQLMLATSALVQLGTDIFQFFIPIYGHSIGLSASAIGMVLAAFAVASFVVRLFLPRLMREVAGYRLLAWTFCLGMIAFALVPFFTHTVALAAVSFFFGLGMGVSMPLTVILMYETIQGRAGQTLGLRLSVNNLVRVVGPVAFGAVGSAFGMPPVFWLNGAMMMIGALLARISGSEKAPERRTP